MQFVTASQGSSEKNHCSAMQFVTRLGLRLSLSNSLVLLALVLCYWVDLWSPQVLSSGRVPDTLVSNILDNQLQQVRMFLRSIAGNARLNPHRFSCCALLAAQCIPYGYTAFSVCGIEQLVCQVISCMQLAMRKNLQLSVQRRN